MGSTDGLYDRIAKQCNAEQIRDFLRPYKNTNEITKKEITVSDTKDELIKTLSRGVAKGYFPVEAVINLLRECEENGDQHIFYFKPANRTVKERCRDAGAVKERLVGATRLEKAPTFKFRDGRYDWVDFRTNSTGKPKDWAAKIYGHEKYFEQIDVEWPTPDKRVETFAAQTVNIVCLVRWNDPDILEIRIDSQRLASVRARLERLRQVWELLRGVFDEEDFVPWDLGPSRSFMAENRNGHEDFELGDLRLIDSDGGSATFKTNDEDESVDDLPARSQAISVLAKVSDCDVLSIHWKIPQEGKEEPLVLSTVCGGRFGHELLIRARTSSKTVDHVTNKLREFDGRTA